MAEYGDIYLYIWQAVHQSNLERVKELLDEPLVSSCHVILRDENQH